MPASILIVEDEKSTREGLALALEDKYEVYEAGNADEAFRLMNDFTFDAVLTDLRMAGKSGMSVIERTLELPNKPVCIMMTAYGSIETAVEAMKRGAYDFLTKPVSLEKLEILIARALKKGPLEKENVDLGLKLDKKLQFNSIIIGESASITAALDEVERVAPSKATVLLEGETGTGKELFAQLIHQNSPRVKKPFIPVHCAALPENLLESELFGHEKGAFTGASQKRVGRFEAAEGGTLFLDEIGEITLATQVKLLRFLETKTFERLGSTKSITVDVRLVCATNRDLAEMVKKGEFREDLYYRLNVVAVKLPPLRERLDDISILIDHYTKVFAEENTVEEPILSEEALEIVKKYDWPGNIRELRNFCENIVVLHQGEEISKEDLDPRFLYAKPKAPSSKPKLSKEAKEKTLIEKALEKARGNKTKAAEILGISRRTLHRKLTQWPELDE